MQSVSVDPDIKFVETQFVEAGIDKKLKTLFHDFSLSNEYYFQSHLALIDKDTRIILFYADREEAKRIFTAANELNMTGKEYQ